MKTFPALDPFANEHIDDCTVPESIWSGWIKSSGSLGNVKSLDGCGCFSRSSSNVAFESVANVSVELINLTAPRISRSASFASTRLLNEHCLFDIFRSYAGNVDSLEFCFIIWTKDTLSFFPASGESYKRRGADFSNREQHLSWCIFRSSVPDHLPQHFLLLSGFSWLFDWIVLI